MRALEAQPTAAGEAGGRRAGPARVLAVVLMAAAMMLSATAVKATADDVNLTPGPTIIKDPSSPTGYTGHFVFYNPTATSVRFVADILLRNWEDQTDTTVYQPQQYRPGLMRGAGAYDVQMTNAGNGYWVTDVPLAAGPKQDWFYVNNNANLWVTDPANAPIYAPDGLTGTTRRAFNAVYVPYDAEKQNYGPLAERVIANPDRKFRTGRGAMCRSRSAPRRGLSACISRPDTTRAAPSPTRRSIYSTAADRTSPTGSTSAASPTSWTT
jgi:hypothetical protein